MKTPHKQLEEIGKKIAEVDRKHIHLLGKRLKLCEQVAKIKLKYGMPFVRCKVESKRLNQASKWAREEGVNSEFARASLYGNIGESCKIQLAVRDRADFQSSRKNSRTNRVIR